MDETEQFKSEREEKFGGKIRFMTYSTFIGEADSQDKPNRGGILYVINDTLHFEDFERQNTLMAMMGRKEKYSKRELSIDLEDISLIKEIKDKNANDCIFGLLDENEIFPAPRGLFALFTKSAVQIKEKNRPSLFFDFLDREGIISLINEYMLRPEE